MAAGVASGSALAGVVVDNADPALAFALAAVALTVTAALTTAGRRRLTPAG
jgi:predicted MFS family arabinose efflux permease